MPELPRLVSSSRRTVVARLTHGVLPWYYVCTAVPSYMYMYRYQLTGTAVVVAR